MIRRKNECDFEVRDAMRNGPGSVEQTKFVSKEELLNHGRLFGKLTLKPGCGIGEHDHQGETEMFYVIKGEAQYTDDDETVIIKEGDVAVCEPGHRHSITNVSNEVCEVVALIVLQ